MPHRKSPICIWCGEEWEMAPKGRRPTAKLPKDDPRFCTRKCAADWAMHMATNPSFNFYDEWCAKHALWYPSGETEGSGDCPGCEEERNEASMEMEREDQERQEKEKSG